MSLAEMGHSRTYGSRTCVHGSSRVIVVPVSAKTRAVSGGGTERHDAVLARLWGDEVAERELCERSHLAQLAAESR